MKKKIIACLLSVMLWLSLCVTAFGVTYGVGLEASYPDAVLAGSTFTYTVHVDPAKAQGGLITLNFILQFNRACLDFVSVEASCPEKWYFDHNLTDKGVHILAEAPSNFSGYYNPCTANAPLFVTFTFRALTAGKASISTSGSVIGTALDGMALLYGNPLQSTVQIEDAVLRWNDTVSEDGDFLVIPSGLGASEVRTLFLFPEAIQIEGMTGEQVGSGATVGLYVQGVCVSQRTLVVMGDCNGNGKLDSNDTLCMRAVYMGTEAFLTEAHARAADLNGNGKLDSNDYIRCRMTLLGMT